MMIWHFHRLGPPQHIGNTDGAETTAEMLRGAQDAGHTTARIAARRTCGNDVDVVMFDSISTLRGYRQRNPEDVLTETAAR